MAPKKILIVAGEASGDLHASHLVRQIKALAPDTEFFGLGGGLLKKEGVEVVCDITDLALIGVTEVLRRLSTIKRAYDKLLEKVDAVKPDLAILVDYPGFNLRLAGELNKRGISVVYYISPQVWAWGASRIGIIKRRVKKVIVFFKFEEELYKAHGIDAEWVGHPLIEAARPTMPSAEVRKRYGLGERNAVIALLPGSRPIEVSLLLPIMASACRLIRKALEGAQFVIVKHPDLEIGIFKKAAASAGVELKIVEGDAYNVLNTADFAVIASGTATLESAIVGTPFVLVYKASLLTRILAWLVMRVKYLGLVNIIAGKEVVPELLQFDATPRKIADTVLEILPDKARISSIRADLEKVKNSLGSPGASTRAARSILPFLR